MHHNITHYMVTERPGKEVYDPVLLGGKSVRCARTTPLSRGACVSVRPGMPQLIDHYPYAGCTTKEVVADPLGEIASMQAL